MGNKKILSIAFSAIIALSIIPFNFAYAQSPLNYVTGFDLNIIEVGYSNTKIWALATNGTVGTTASNWLYEINATTLAIENQYNVTTSSRHVADDLWCSPIYCYVSGHRTTGVSGQLVQVATITSGSETKGSVVNTLNVGNTLTGSTVKIEGRYLTSGSITQIFLISKSAATTGSMDMIDGLSMTLTQSVGFNPLSTNLSDISFIAPTVTEWHAFNQFGDSSVQVINTWDLLDNTLDCTRNLSGTTQTGAQFASYLGTSTNPWLGQTTEITSPNYGTVTRMPSLAFANGTAVSFISVDDSGSCTIMSEDNYLMSELDLANVGLRTAQFDERDSLFFAQEASGLARISIVSYDGITGTISGTPVVYDTNPAVSQSSTNGEFVIMPDLELIMVPETGAGRRIVVLDYSSLVIPSGGGGGTNLPQEPITTSVGQLLCVAGIIASCDETTGAPTNTDIETNGVGIGLTLFLMIFVGGTMIGVSRKFSFNLASIPAEFWLGLTVLVIAFSWYMNWIPDIVFYGMIVGLAGLFSFGLYRQFSGKGG